MKVSWCLKVVLITPYIKIIGWLDSCHAHGCSHGEGEERARYLASTTSDNAELKKLGFLDFSKILFKFWPYLDEFPKEPSIYEVVCLEEDLPEPGLSDGVVLGIELVKPMEGISIL